MPHMMNDRPPPPVMLTKRDATALWRAVDAMREQYRAMKDMPDLAEHLPAARLELARAGAALRKVQTLVRKPKVLMP